VSDSEYLGPVNLHILFMQLPSTSWQLLMRKIFSFLMFANSSSI
jgi:hypothetical protein